MERRKFIKNSSIAMGLSTLGLNDLDLSSMNKKTEKPVVISTWDFGLAANQDAWKILSKGGRALDAVEQGVMVPEADASNSSVGLGGAPDRDGRVTLDACIMDEKGNAGCVTALEHIVHPISVARKVMENTPHVILTGEGALQFALDQGFKKTDLLTEKSKKEWQKWLETSDYKPVINIENHDTIGMLAIDSNGDLSGACTTSGLAYKMHGRVGDSPVIGAGLYVDNEYGAAVCTGLGEVVLKNLSSFLAVELMRNKKSPQKACEIAIERLLAKTPNYKDLQVGMIAINKKGETGAYAIHPNFTYAKTSNTINKVFEAAHKI